MLGLSLAFFSVFALFPFLWMVATAFRSGAELYRADHNPFIIEHFTVEHFLYLFRETDFLVWMRNSTVVAALSSTVSLAVGIIAAYSLGRLRYRGGGAIATAVMAVYLVPAMILFMPLGNLIGRLGLNNTLWALVVVYPTFLAPFATWILIGYFKTTPRELMEAALVDGATRLQAMLRIELPLILPGLVSVFFFTFTSAWNEYLYAYTFVTSPSRRTVVVGVVNHLMAGDVYYWGELMAAALLGAIPVVVIYAFMMDFYIAGLTAGAVKA